MDNDQVKANIFRVFVDEKGNFGNGVGVIVDEAQQISSEERQEITKKLGFSESVFIDDLTTGKVSIFNPEYEVKFAGHALIGTAYFLSKVLNQKIDAINCKGGSVRFWNENELTWIQASVEGTPPWNHKQLETPEAVENISDSDIPSYQHTMVWAWVNKETGIVRARTFAPDWGIPEDQGNGSGSMQLAAMLKQRLEIHHGKGSVIIAEPAGKDVANVGGRVVQDRQN